MKKTIFVSTLLGAAVFTSSSLLADGYQSYYCCPPPAPCKAEEHKDGCKKEEKKEEKKEDDDCCCKSFWDGKFKVGADALYWEAIEGQLSIGNEISINAAGDEIENKIIRPNFGAEWGWKVSAGYEAPCEQKWDILFTYGHMPYKAHTRFYQTTNTDPEHPRDYILLRTLNYDILATSAKIDGGQVLSAQFATMQGFWKGYVDGYDISLTRKLSFFKDRFSLRPQIGYRQRWGKQTYNFGGNFLPVSPAPVTGVTTLAVHLKETWDKYGGFGGLGMAWEIGCGFELVGYFGGSCTYTNWKIFQRGTITNTDPENDFGAVATEHDQFPSIGFGLDYYAGIQYHYHICNYEITAKLQWDHHTSQYNVINSIGANLGFQGLTAGLKVAF